MNVTKDGWCSISIARLREAWLPIPTIDIARELGCTTNAVIGKAARLRLEKKPRSGGFVSSGPRAARRSHHKIKRDSPAPKSPSPVADLECRPVFAVTVRTQAPSPPVRRGGGCQWTDSSCRPWIWCGAPCVSGRSWCAQHYRVVYAGARVVAT